MTSGRVPGAGPREAGPKRLKAHEANDACVRDKNGQEARRSTEATLFLATSADGRNWYAPLTRTYTRYN